MSTNTALTEFLDTLVAERTEIENIDKEAIVRERLAEIELRIRAEVEVDVARRKEVVNIKIETLEMAIQRVESAEAEAQIATEIAEDSEIPETNNGIY